MVAIASLYLNPSPTPNKHLPHTPQQCARTHKHSRPPRTDSERTRKSWPSEILTTSAALGSSAMAVMSEWRVYVRSERLYARQTLPMTARGTGGVSFACILGSSVGTYGF